MATTYGSQNRVNWKGLELEVDHLSVGGYAITGTEMSLVDDLTASAAEINSACDVSARYIALAADATTYTVLATNSGKTHVMPDLDATCVFTMPAASAGLEYRFIYSGAAIEAHDWTFDLSTTSNFFKGGLMHVDEDDTQANVSSNGSSNDFMRIIKPDTGTMVSLLCDGTNWIAYGQVYGADAPTFADT